MTRLRTARGAATLLVIAMAGVLMLVAGALGVAEAMVVAHRHAQAAADLAALAGAQQPDDPCGSAGAAASANGARLLSCQAVGRDVRVVVAVSGPRWLGQDADLTARARAGPSAGASGVPP
jgi:secretion/DNA translocation related TadE-like protein